MRSSISPTPFSQRAAVLSEQLAIAAAEGDLAAVATLMAQGADPQAQCSLPLRRAAGRGHLECAKLLMPLSEPKAEDSEALRRAAMHGHADCVKLLIPTSDPKARSSEALLIAARNGHLDCATLLLPVSHSLAERPAALHQAIDDGCADIVARMLDHEPSLLGLIDLEECRAQASLQGRDALAALLFSASERLALSVSNPASPKLVKIPPSSRL